MSAESVQNAVLAVEIPDRPSIAHGAILLKGWAACPTDACLIMQTFYRRERCQCPQTDA